MNELVVVQQHGRVVTIPGVGGLPHFENRKLDFDRVVVKRILQEEYFRIDQENLELSFLRNGVRIYFLLVISPAGVLLRNKGFRVGGTLHPIKPAGGGQICHNSPVQYVLRVRPKNFELRKK